VTQAANTLTTSENRKLAVLMRMALTYADAAGAEPETTQPPLRRRPLPRRGWLTEQGCTSSPPFSLRQRRSLIKTAQPCRERV